MEEQNKTIHNMDQIEQAIDELEINTPEIKEDPTPAEAEKPDATKELSESDKVDVGVDKVEEGKAEGGKAGEEIPAADQQQEKEPLGEPEVPQQEKEEDVNDPGAEVQNDLPPVDDTKGNDEITDKVEDTPTLNEEYKKMKEELEQLKFEKETIRLNDNFQGLVQQQQDEFNKFSAYLGEQINKEMEKYGIPHVEDIEELRAIDIGKYQIAQNILTNAEHYAIAVREKMQQPVVEAANAIIARVAGNEIDKYKLNPDQQAVACETFLAIYNQDGLRDLSDDLKAKVELAVARAKLLHQDVKDVVEDTKKLVDDVKDGVKEIIEKPAEEPPKAPEPPKEIKKDIGAYTEGVNPGLVAKGAPVNEDNVNEIFFSLDGKEKLEFFAKYKDMLMKNNRPMPYTDGNRG